MADIGCRFLFFIGRFSFFPLSVFGCFHLIWMFLGGKWVHFPQPMTATVRLGVDNTYMATKSCSDWRNDRCSCSNKEKDL